MVSSLAATALSPSQQSGASPSTVNAGVDGSNKKKRRLSFSSANVSSEPNEGEKDENQFIVPAVPSAGPATKRARSNTTKANNAKPTTPIASDNVENTVSVANNSSGKKKGQNTNNLLEKFDATLLPPPVAAPVAAPADAPAVVPAPVTTSVTGGRRVMGLAPGAAAARRAAAAGNRNNNSDAGVMDSLLMLG